VVVGRPGTVECLLRHIVLAGQLQRLNDGLTGRSTVPATLGVLMWIVGFVFGDYSVTSKTSARLARRKYCSLMGLLTCQGWETLRGGSDRTYGGNWCSEFSLMCDD